MLDFPQALYLPTRLSGKSTFPLGLLLPCFFCFLLKWKQQQLLALG